MTKGMNDHMYGNRTKNERGFTLIELMATLVILALIIAIAVPAIGKLVTKSSESADKASIALMERAGEMAYIDNLKTDDAAERNKDLPASITEKDVYMIPTLIEKGYLKLDEKSKFNKPENYVKKIDKSGKFIYMGEGKDAGDKPANEDVAMGSCARDGAYTASTGDYDWKTVERNVSYQEIMMDADGNYIAAGYFGGTADSWRGGNVLDKYDKDMKLIASQVELWSDYEHIQDYPDDDPELYINDMIQNNDGDYVMVDEESIVVFDKSFASSKRYEPDSMYMTSMNQGIVQNKDGHYFVAGIVSGELAGGAFYDDQFGVVELDRNFEYVDHMYIERAGKAGSGNTTYNNLSIRSFELLANGDLLIAANDQAWHAAFYQVSQELELVSQKSIDLGVESMVKDVAQLQDGTIVALVDSDNAERLAFYVFDANLALEQVVPVNADYGDWEGYSRLLGDSTIYVDGNQFTIYVSGELITYDRDVTEVSRVAVGDAPFGGYAPKALKDGNDWVVFDVNGYGYTYGIHKIKNVGLLSDGRVAVTDTAPRAIHTDLPAIWRVDGYDVMPPVDEESEVSAAELYDMHADFGTVVDSGYQKETNRVNPIFARSLLIVGLLDGAEPAIFIVLDDGTLKSAPIDLFTSGTIPDEFTEWGYGPEKEPLMYVLANNKQWVVASPSMGVPTAPDGSTLVPRPASASDGENATKVDPCYAGAFMIQISDEGSEDPWVMNKVEADGSLTVMNGDLSTLFPEDFGYDVFSDSLFYRYPSGLVVDFPSVRAYSIH